MKLTTLLLASLLVTTGCVSNDVIQHGIPNLSVVDANRKIYRCGQPDNEGWDYIHDVLGVTNVIEFNTVKDSYAESTGITVHYHPIPWWKQTILRPNNADLHKAVGEITDRTVIKCAHGQDRSGLAVGCFGLSQGQSKSDAYQGMLDHKFHPALQGLQGRWNTQRECDWK